MFFRTTPRSGSRRCGLMRPLNMWNTAMLCLMLGMILSHSLADSRVRRSRNSKLISLRDGYASATHVGSLTTRLPSTFGYHFTDDYGTMQTREEKTDPNGSKTGSYSFVDAAGIYRRVDYVADHYGFRATVTTNEPGTMPVDPANVRMLTKSQPSGHMPQLEYSNNVFAKDNPSDMFARKIELKKIVVSTSALPDSGVERQRKTKTGGFKDVSDVYKGSSFSPAVSSLIQNLNDPKPVAYDNSGGLGGESFPERHPLKSYFAPGSKHREYSKKVPTRYPRKHRDSRGRIKPSLKIHTPRGYEGQEDLPLYRDR